MSDWPIESLHDKISIKHGFPFKSEFFSEHETNYIVLTPGNFFEQGGFKRQAGKEKFYTGGIPEDYLHRKNDLIVAMTEQAAGLLGSCARVPESGVYLHNQRLGLIRANPEKVSLEFIYHLFKTKTVREQIRASSSGSKVKHTSPERIYDVKVPFPSLDEQKKIAKFLDVIEQKIELNNKINAELEAMAKLIYDYCFVQFEFPDANGNPYKSSGGKMVYNLELKRDIPEGWRVETLGNVESNIVTGKTPSTKKTENFNGKIPFICIGDVRGNMHVTKAELSLSDIGAESQSNKYIPEGAICVTCIASPGLVGFATEKSQTNQQLNTVVCDKFENRYYLYFYLKDYFRFATAKSGNTFANMSKGDFSDIKVIQPSSELLKLFSEKLKPSIEKILVNSRENNKLIELRDWLLPMLMNGQVSIETK